MQAVILAAGKGTRMRPLTYKIPKAMLPVKGKPILHYTINSLPEAVSEVIIVINYLGNHIKKYFGNSYLGKKIRYVKQRELNGTGGAIHACKDWLRDKFLVLMGDDLYFKNDLMELLNHDAGALAYEVEDPGRFGVFSIDNENNLLGIIEKPATKENKLANIGVYVLNQNFFDYPLIAVNEKEFGLPQTMVQMARNFPVKIVKATYWHAVGYPEDIKLAEKELKNFLT